MRKLWPFSPGFSPNRQKEEDMTCVELWKASRKLLQLDLWLCGFPQLYEKSKIIPNGHQMRKLWPFSRGGRFNRERKTDMTCIKLWRPRASHWSWNCGFLEVSFRLLHEKSKIIPNGHQMRKLRPFSPGGRFNWEKKEEMSCIELWKPRASYWSWACIYSG